MSNAMTPDRPAVLDLTAALIASVIAGFAVALAMWCVWFVAHLPGLGWPSAAAGGALVATLTLGAAIATPMIARGPRRLVESLLAGAITGGTAATLNLLIMGSRLVEQPQVVDPAAIGANGDVGVLQPSAPMIALGFLGAGLIAGAIGGLIGSIAPIGFLRRSAAFASAVNRRATMALIAAASITPLLLLGGLVTSTESGMAVPDWPGTYGANMFLYPIGLMAHPRIFLEHTHRLFGALAGLNALAVLLLTLPAHGYSKNQGLKALVAMLVVLGGIGAALIAHLNDGLTATTLLAIGAGAFVVTLIVSGVGAAKGLVKWGAAAVFTLVALQGMLGGIRVTANDAALALAHGVGGQLVFAASVALAAAMLPMSPATDDGTKRARLAPTMGAITLGALFIQLSMGAMYRHLGHAHALWTHVGFSIIAVVASALAGHWFARLGGGLKPLGHAIVGVVALQFVLGWGALFGVLGTEDRGPSPTHEQLATAEAPPAHEVILATAHQANGALLLGLVSFGTVRAVRRRR